MALFVDDTSDLKCYRSSTDTVIIYEKSFAKRNSLLSVRDLESVGTESPSHGSAI